MDASDVLAWTMSHVEIQRYPRCTGPERPPSARGEAIHPGETRRKSGLDPTYISDIERGRRNPGIKNVARLAKALGSPRRNCAKGWTREREKQKAGGTSYTSPQSIVPEEARDSCNSSLQTS